MAQLAIKPTLVPLTRFVQTIHISTTNASGVEVDYTNTGSPPSAFFATSNAYNATAAHANLNCAAAHLGSGWWLFTIPAADLTFAILNGAFTMPGTPPVLLVLTPGCGRDFAIGEYYPYRKATGNSPILYPDCKLDLAIEFTTTDNNGDVVDYTSAMGTPSCFFSASRAHDATTAHANLTCALTWLSGRQWSASIPQANITYALLNSLFPSPTPFYFIQIVPSSSRDYSDASWQEYREALAA